MGISGYPIAGGNNGGDAVVTTIIEDALNDTESPIYTLLTESILNEVQTNATATNIAIIDLITQLTTIQQYDDSSLPIATTVPSGTKVFNTTYQIEMMSDGTQWIPLSQFSFYAAGVSDEITGTTDLVLIREIDLPQKYIGKDGRISLFLQSLNNSTANTKTLVLRLWDGTTEWEFLSVTSSTNWKTIMRHLACTGTECNFFNAAKAATTDSAVSASSSGSSQQLDASSSTFKLRIYGQLAVGTDFMRLTKLNLHIIPGF